MQSERSGSVAERGTVLVSRSRSIQIAGSPSFAHGSMSWNSEAATCVAGALGARPPEERLPVAERRLVRADVGRHHRLVHGHADHLRIDASSRSGSVFDRIASRHPLQWRSLSAPGTSVKTGHEGERPGQGVAFTPRAR